MKRLFQAAALSALVLAGGAGTAHALSYQMVFDGAVTPGGNFDIYDTFGVGGNLDSQKISVRLRYNANPGDTYLTSSEITSMGLTINSVNFNLKEGKDGVPAITSFFRNDIYDVLAAWGDVTFSNSTSPFNRLGLYGGPITGIHFADDLTTAFSKTISCRACRGSFIAAVFTPGSNNYFMGSYNINKVSVSPVPLPASFTLFLTAAAGLFGFSWLRRKKQLA